MSSVKWELTQRCNLKCKHCFVGKIEYERDMGIDNAKKMLNIIKSSGVSEIVLSTKEPLAYPNICELLEYCADLNLYVTLVTNGTLITDRVLRCLSKCKVKNLSVSLEGISAETNDYVRGKGVFEKVIDAVDRVDELNYTTKYSFPLALQISLTSKNYSEIKEMIDWFEKSPFMAVNVGDISILGNATENRELKLTEEQYERAVDILLENYSKLDNVSFVLNLKKSTPYDTLYLNMKYGLCMECVVPSCAAYHGYYSLLPNGDTCSCVALTDDSFSSYENLKSDYNLLRDGKFENITRISDLGKYKESGFCNKCRYRKECELCLLIVYDDSRFKESTKKCYLAYERLEKTLDDILIGKRKFRLNPHVFIYEQEGKATLKKISQTGTVSELDITNSQVFIKQLFLKKEYVCIKSITEIEQDKSKGLIKELMYNDMLQIEKEEE